MLIKLVSSDNVTFEVDEKVARMSVMIKTMLDQGGINEDHNQPIPISNVHSTILQKVIEWINYHEMDTQQCSTYIDEYQKKFNCISPWDAKFLKVDEDTLCDLIMAANFLDIPGLLDVACTKVAKIMSGKSPAEIRMIFNITDK